MRCLAVDLAPHRILVNAVCPSTVNSPMLMNQATWSLFAGGKPDATVADAAFPARNMHLLPVPWVEPEDVSGAVLWLISDEARYVTGVALEVDAGAAAQPNGIPPEAMTRVVLPPS